MSQQQCGSGHLPSASGWLLPGQAQRAPPEQWQGAVGRMLCPRANLGLGAGALVSTRTQNFHHFLKLALTKNPKKRPTAEKLLQVGGRGLGQGDRLQKQGPGGQGPTCPRLHPPAPVHDPAAPAGSPYTIVGQGQ